MLLGLSLLKAMLSCVFGDILCCNGSDVGSCSRCRRGGEKGAYATAKGAAPTTRARTNRMVWVLLADQMLYKKKPSRVESALSLKLSQCPVRTR
jgi:hypothetical protein